MREFLPVVIASYQRPKLIKQAIESLRKNSYHNIKIIVVDNSTDPETINYLEAQQDIILYRWGKRKSYPHLRVTSPNSFDYPTKQETSPYWNTKWSLGKSRTKGALLAPPSKYIYFSDNDMYFTKDWDRVLITALKKYPSIILVGGAGQHTSDRPRRVDSKHNVRLASLQVGNTMMFRREQWEQIGFFPDYSEDFWMSLEARSRFNKWPGVIDPFVTLHCGMKSFYKGGELNRGKKQSITYDRVNIETNKLRYPELIVE